MEFKSTTITTASTINTITQVLQVFRKQLFQNFSETVIQVSFSGLDQTMN